MITLIVKTTDGIYEFTPDESKLEHVGWFVEDGVLFVEVAIGDPEMPRGVPERFHRIRAFNANRWEEVEVVG